jgi:ABC-2 type transport system permease protein
VSSAYLELIRIRFIMMLAYRVNYYSGILVYALNIGAYYFIWNAIYEGKDTLQGFTLTQMTTYTVVSWMSRAFYFNNLDREISTEIRDGSVAIQFIRPYNYIVVKMMQGLGEGIFRLLLFTAPGLLITSFLFPIKLPTDPYVWIMYLLMLFMAFLINTQLNIITGLSAFFLENAEGLMRMKRIALDLFSGLFVPITFFPAWSSWLIKLLPFQAITYLPGSVFTGRVHGSGIVQILGIQIFWFVILTIPMMLLWRSARKRLFVQGG